MNFSNRGEEFPDKTKVLPPPVASGISPHNLLISVKGPDQNRQLS